MGFEMLPIEPGDLDKVNPIYDIFEITSPDKWTPSRHRSDTVKADPNQATSKDVANIPVELDQPHMFQTAHICTKPLPTMLFKHITNQYLFRKSAKLLKMTA